MQAPSVQSSKLLLASIGVLVFLCIVFVYRLVFHPLARIPGPFLARITGNWRTCKNFRGSWHSDILLLHKKYGRIVRIAPNEVSVVSEKAVKQLYGHGTKARKTKWYMVWWPRDIPPNFFSVIDPKEHSIVRRRVSNAFTMSSIIKYEPYIQSCLDLLWQQLKKHSNSDHPIVDMSEWTNMLAFDVIGELGFGEQLGQLRT